MPTKVCIIDVDLGMTVDDIISENVAAIVGQARTDLDNALEAAKAVQRVKKEREEKAKTIENKLNTVMTEAYTQLANAGENGISVDAIMSIVAGAVPNSSAFTTRMKNVLSEKGNDYRLERKKVSGIPHYCFTPFNKIETVANGGAST